MSRHQKRQTSEQNQEYHEPKRVCHSCDVVQQGNAGWHVDLLVHRVVALMALVELVDEEER